MRAVAYTNGIVSAVISRTGAPSEVLRLWRQRWFELVVSDAILAEYERALNYERVRVRCGRSTEEIRNIVAEFREFALLIEPTETPAVIEDDPDDDKFLWCADAADAEFIVSRDEHLLRLRRYKGVQILSPAAFLNFLREQQIEEGM